jgi:hypothetical protein
LELIIWIEFVKKEKKRRNGRKGRKGEGVCWRYPVWAVNETTPLSVLKTISNSSS